MKAHIHTQARLRMHGLHVHAPVIEMGVEAFPPVISLVAMRAGSMEAPIRLSGIA